MTSSGPMVIVGSNSLSCWSVIPASHGCIIGGASLAIHACHGEHHQQQMQTTVGEAIGGDSRVVDIDGTNNRTSHTPDCQELS